MHNMLKPKHQITTSLSETVAVWAVSIELILYMSEFKQNLTSSTHLHMICNQ